MKYYIIAGEASGDLHGANLMRALQQQDPQASIRFWGGDAMKAVGGTQVKHIKDLAYMGFIEVATHFRTILGNIAFCKKDIENYHPDAIIYIDYPGFNLKIAKFAHQRGYRNFHYISPQLWAWKKGRITSMRRDIDRLYCILPFEKAFYERNNFPQALFVGHPLLDAVARFKASDTQHSAKPIIALLPGSRKQEVSKMLPEMLKVVPLHPEYQFVIAGMSLLGDDFYRNVIQNKSYEVEIWYDKTYELLTQSHAALVCSGTATLETALFNVPQVVCYKANPLSIAIARHFVGKRVKYISLVNLIADAPVVCELIQNDFNIETLDAEFRKAADNLQPRQNILSGYAALFAKLGNAGASERVATDILKNICNLRSKV